MEKIRKNMLILLCILSNTAFADETVGSNQIQPQSITLTTVERENLVNRLQSTHDTGVVSAYVMINTAGSVSGMQLVRSTLPNQPNSKEVKTLSTFISDASHPDGLTSLDIVKVTTSQEKLIQLAHNEQVTDILGIQCCGSDTVEGFFAFDTQKARFIDKHSTQFSKAQSLDKRVEYYKKLMNLLDDIEKTEIFVVLRTRAKNLDNESELILQKSEDEIDSLLSIFGSKEIDVTYRGYYSFTMVADKTLSGELYKDDRVEFIRSVYLATKDNRIGY